MARNYNLSRGLSLETADAWRAAILRHAPAITSSVLDLGSGTGRFSALLAECLGATVMAVEPAQEMRAKALEGAVRPDFFVTEGRAEQIPLPDASVDLAWLGFMIHHVTDRDSCGRELSRVVRPDGVILMAGAFPGYLDGITLFNFFPEARAVAQSYPSLDVIVADFDASGLIFEAIAPIVQQTAPHLAALAGRTRLRADTTLSLMSDEAFARGQQAIERAAAQASAPVVDTLHLAMFRRRSSTPTPEVTRRG